MKQYLLSIYQPDGDPPPPEVLEPIMKDLEAVNAEMRAAGAWVFSGGLNPPGSAAPRCRSRRRAVRGRSRRGRRGRRGARGR